VGTEVLVQPCESWRAGKDPGIGVRIRPRIKMCHGSLQIRARQGLLDSPRKARGSHQPVSPVADGISTCRDVPFSFLG
jgi:hypothetical protein